MIEMAQVNVSKQHILDEIHRTAKANNNVPLGVARFFQETGIRDVDWAGKFWARWGDALTEAGFQRNEFNTAYDEAFLLSKLASLTMEIQRFPVKRELQMKAKSDADFPSANCFLRLARKHELARKLHEFCSNRAEFQDVVAICASVTSRRPEAPTSSPTSEIGYVYLMKSGKFYKIGRSNAAGRREYEISIQMPERLTTVHIIRTDDPPGIEEYWHKRFADKRKNGEWFDLQSGDIQAFKRRKFM